MKTKNFGSECDVSRVIEELDSRIQNLGYSGYDPYDALNGSLVVLLSGGTKWGRIAWTQFFRRMPVNLRPLFGIRPGPNPKGIGLLLGAYTRLHAITAGEYSDQIERSISLLKDSRTFLGQGHGWGYNFDWQNRAFFLPKFTPTIVNSAFIDHAFLDAYAEMGIEDALELAVPVADFMLNGLHRTTKGDTFCFSYTPLDKSAVHNANLLGASLLMRLAKVAGRSELLDPAFASLAYTMNAQNEDGSWFYGEAPYQKWIDSFHTGFNLECLRYFLRAGEADKHREAYDRGVRFYAGNFFLEDGTPKYYHNRVYPIDIHCPTTAIAFFAGEGNKHEDLTARILRWMLTHMYDPRGFFYFRKGPRLTNKTPYMRWSQAWAFRALTEYVYQRGKADAL